MGCDEETVKRACQAAARAIRDGETAHRAILAGVNVAAQHVVLDRRRTVDIDVPQHDLSPSFLDSVLLVVVVGIVVLALYLLARALGATV
jgi:hypothetical protein